MKITLLHVLGAAAALGAGYVIYQKVAKPALATSLPAGEASQATIAQGQPNQTLSIKVGDYVSAPGQTTAPMTSGSIFGGNEASLANGGTITAMTAGTENLTWPDGTTATITAS